MTVHLCEDYGLDSLEQPWAVLQGSRQLPLRLHCRIDIHLLRAVLRNGPPGPASGPIGAWAVSGPRSATGRRLRTFGTWAASGPLMTDQRMYLRSSRSPGPNRARTGGRPKELRISEQPELGI